KRLRPSDSEIGVLGDAVPAHDEAAGLGQRAHRAGLACRIQIHEQSGDAGRPCGETAERTIARRVISSDEAQVSIRIDEDLLVSGAEEWKHERERKGDRVIIAKL